MPWVASRVDALRRALGIHRVDDILRRARQGEMTFYAREGGHEFGTPMPEVVQWLVLLEDAFGTDLAIVARREVEEDGLVAHSTSIIWNASDGLDARRFCNGCAGECIGKGTRCSEREPIPIQKIDVHSGEIWARPEEFQPVETPDPTEPPPGL